MKLARGIVTLLSVSCLTMGQAALAQPLGHGFAHEHERLGFFEGRDTGKKGDAEHGGGGFFQSLGLSDEQRSQLKALKPQREQNRALREQMQAARKDVREAFQNDQASREEVLAKVQKLNAISAERNIKRAEMLLTLRGILTPEQRAKFREHMQQRMQERHAGGQRDDEPEEQGDRE